jgi:hypothetical protein
MNSPRCQQVSDVLHHIAELVQEADSYLCESKLMPATSFKRPKFVASPRSFNKLKPIKPRKSVIEPHKADGVTNAARRMGDFATSRSIFRAARERKQRSRDHARKGVVDIPRKLLGTRFRMR